MMVRFILVETTTPERMRAADRDVASERALLVNVRAFDSLARGLET